MRRQKEIPVARVIAGYRVVVDPSKVVLKKLQEKAFTGFTLSESIPEKLPWAVWSFGRIDCWVASEEEAVAVLIKKYGRRG